jgi:3D (Asp-Asp-Asp) domain-containing protein
MTLTRRGERAAGWAVGLLLVASPGVAGVIGTAVTGVSDAELLSPEAGVGSTPRPTVQAVPARPAPSAASRRRALVSARPTPPRRHHRTLDVTAYCHTGNRTASGVWPRPGMAAGNQWPFGTRLRVEHVGVVTVTDRIGWGSELDLYMSSCTKARQFGRRHLKVEVAS